MTPANQPIDQTKPTPWLATALLAPSVLVLLLVLLSWASPTGSVPAWGRLIFWLSPLLVLYNLGILIIFARRKVPVWIKTIEITIIVVSLLPLTVLTWLMIRAICGIEILPVPAD